MQRKYKPKDVQVFLVFSVILLLIFVCGIAVMKSRDAANQSPVGTFCTGTGMSEEDQYIALYSDNRYLQYRQFFRQSSGTYEVEPVEGGVMICLTDQNGAETRLAYDGKDVLAEIDEKPFEAHLTYHRVNDVPMEINLP